MGMASSYPPSHEALNITVEETSVAGFCTNSNHWLDFLFFDPKSCPYESCIYEQCGYYKEREPTEWYKRKKKALQALKES